MKLFHLVIKGRIPSKKNNRRNYVKTSLPSVKFLEWHHNATTQLLSHKGLNMDKFDAQFEFWMPDNRVTDIDNKVSSVLDLLKDLNIIVDDSWQHLESYYARACGIDKKNPRVEIWLRSLY